MTERPRPDAGRTVDGDDGNDGRGDDRDGNGTDGEGTESGDDRGNGSVVAGPSNGGDADLASDALTHTTDAGDAQMVDVGDKPDTARRAVASGAIRLRASTVEAIRADEIGKGNVLATARVGAIQAVKHTWEAIPMCHAIPITNVDTEFDVRDERITLTVAVETTGKTGCEMEALEGVTTGLNTVWDMVKAAEKDAEGQYPGTAIEDVRVLEKQKRSL